MSVADQKLGSVRASVPALGGTSGQFPASVLKSSRSLRRSDWAARVIAVAMVLAGADAALAQAAAPVATPATTGEPIESADVDSPTRPVTASAVGVNDVAGALGIALSPDGRSRLHLGVDAGVGIDTNPYLLPLADGKFVGDAVARVRPNAAINYPGSLVAFDADAAVDFGFLPDAFSVGTTTSAGFPLLFQSRLGAGIEVNRGGMFSFALADNFAFNRDPGLLALGQTLNRITNGIRAGIGVRPGGGTMTWKLNAGFDIQKWLDLDNVGGPIADGVLDSYTLSADTRFDWRFLPRTGMFAQASIGWNNYYLSNVNPTSLPMAVNVGLMGQFTQKLTGLASIGYSNPLTLDTDPVTGQYGVVSGNLLGLVGQAEIQWAFLQTARVAGGFIRTVNPAPLYQFAFNNRVYLNYTQTILNRFSIGLNAGYSLLNFGEEQAGLIPGGGTLTTATKGRTDHRVDGIANLNYYVLDWLAFGLFNRFSSVFTNADAAAANGVLRNLSYVRNETLLVATVRY
jgi:hypothetical protein